MPEQTSTIHDHVLMLLDASTASAILDVGCGRGEHLQCLASQVSPRARLVGIDSSENSIAAARAAVGNDSRFTFLVHDFGEGIPFPDGAFDRIFSVNVFEAIPDKTSLLRELHRVLSPDGRVVVSHYDWDSQLYDGTNKALVRRLVHAFADWKQKWMADADGWMAAGSGARSSTRDSSKAG